MRLPRRTSVLATAAVGLAIFGAWLLLTSQSRASQAPQPAPGAATSSPASPPRETQPASSPQPSSPQPSSDNTGPATAVGEPPAQATQEDVADAMQVSVDFVDDWLSPGVANWWPSLEERMTPSAAQAYEVDPEEVPSGHRVSADPVALGDASKVLCRVEVPTTRGEYRVTLAREHAEGQWLVDRIVPPDQ